MWKNIKFTFGILVIFKIHYITTFNYEGDFMGNEVDLRTYENDPEVTTEKTEKLNTEKSKNTTRTTTDTNNIEETSSNNNDTTKYFEVTSILNEDDGIFSTTETFLEHTRTTSKNVNTTEPIDTDTNENTANDVTEQTERETTSKNKKETTEVTETTDDTDITEQSLIDTTELTGKSEKYLTEDKEKEVSEKTENKVTKKVGEETTETSETAEDTDITETTRKADQSGQDTTYKIEEPTKFTIRTDSTKKTLFQTRRGWVPSDVKKDSKFRTKLDSLKKKVYEKTRQYFHKVNDAKRVSSKKQQKNGKSLFTYLKKFVSQANGCAHYKQSPKEFNMDAMVDVWQTLYYQLTEKVFCFKIYIRKLTQEDKDDFVQTYGNFSGKVDWSKCNLEIKSAEKLDRKHFLQGTNSDNGVFKNVIIMEDKDSEPPYLKEETPDQWMVVKHLLLMRDCETGGMLVFSRFPHQPGRKVVLGGLQKFGEKEHNGRMACEENEVSGKTFGDDENSADAF